MLFEGPLTAPDLFLVQVADCLCEKGQLAGDPNASPVSSFRSKTHYGTTVLFRRGLVLMNCLRLAGDYTQVAMSRLEAFVI